MFSKLLTFLAIFGLFSLMVFLTAKVLGLGSADLFFGLLGNRGEGKSYQAIFLSNGATYFGQIEKKDATEVRLSHVFYLRPREGNPVATSAAANSNLELVKLGDEIHGPKDLLVLNRRFIIATEDLKIDSRVLKLIEGYYGRRGVSEKKPGKLEVKP